MNIFSLKPMRGQHIAIFIAILASSIQAGFQEFYHVKYYSFANLPFQGYIGFRIGFCLSWPIGNMLGRKHGLLWSNGFLLLTIVFNLIGSTTKFTFLNILSWSFVGVHDGAAFGLNLLYIFETSPRISRGMAITAYFLLIHVSSLAMEFLAKSPGIRNREREEGPLQFLWLALIPSGIQIFCLLFCPESPGYSAVQKEDIGKAELDLKLIENSPRIPEAIRDFQSELTQTISSPSPLTLSVLLGIASSLSQFWMEGYLFLNSAIGTQVFDIHWVGEGLLTMFTLISVGIVDRVKRKSFLFTVIAGITMINITLLVIILFGEISQVKIYENLESVVLIKLLICVGYSLTILGPRLFPFLIILELADQKTRAKRLVLSHILAYFINFALKILKKFILSEQSEDTKGLIYFTLAHFGLCICLLLVSTIWKKLPETGGKTVEEISQQINTYANFNSE